MAVKKQTVMLAAAAAATLISTGQARVHPHVFAEARLDVTLNPDQSVKSLRHLWRFDDLFSALGRRHGFREYLTGLPAPRERDQTLTCLAGTEPVVGAQQAVPRLQFFLTELVWDLEQVNARRLEGLPTDPATAPNCAPWACLG